jgi:hypothetical protein
MEMADYIPPPTDLSLPRDTTQMVLMTMAVDSETPTLKENSPTPKADIPLAPTNPTNTSLLASIAEMLKPINEHLKSLEANEQWCTHKEGKVHTNTNIPAFDYDQINNNFEKQCAGWAAQHPSANFDDHYNLLDPQDAKAWVN